MKNFKFMILFLGLSLGGLVYSVDAGLADGGVDVDSHLDNSSNSGEEGPSDRDYGDGDDEQDQSLYGKGGQDSGRPSSGSSDGGFFSGSETGGSRPLTPTDNFSSRGVSSIGAQGADGLGNTGAAEQSMDADVGRGLKPTGDPALDVLRRSGESAVSKLRSFFGDGGSTDGSNFSEGILSDADLAKERDARAQEESEDADNEEFWRKKSEYDIQERERVQKLLEGAVSPEDLGATEGDFEYGYQGQEPDEYSNQEVLGGYALATPDSDGLRRPQLDYDDDDSVNQFENEGGYDAQYPEDDEDERGAVSVLNEDPPTLSHREKEVVGVLEGAVNKGQIRSEQMSESISNVRLRSGSLSPEEIEKVKKFLRYEKGQQRAQDVVAEKIKGEIESGKIETYGDLNNRLDDLDLDDQKKEDLLGQITREITDEKRTGLFGADQQGGYAPISPEEDSLDDGEENRRELELNTKESEEVGAFTFRNSSATYDADGNQTSKNGKTAHVVSEEGFDDELGTSFRVLDNGQEEFEDPVTKQWVSEDEYRKKVEARQREAAKAQQQGMDGDEFNRRLEGLNSTGVVDRTGALKEFGTLNNENLSPDQRVLLNEKAREYDAYLKNRKERSIFGRRYQSVDDAADQNNAFGKKHVEYRDNGTLSSLRRESAKSHLDGKTSNATAQAELKGIFKEQLKVN